MPEFKGSLSSKFPHTGTTIFTIMSKMAKDFDAINLSQGFPDFETDEKLLKLIHHYTNNGYMQYAPMQGVEILRKKIAEKTEKIYSENYDFQDEITITAGATQAIFTAISAVVKENDEVIIFTPAYDCYAPAVELNGGKPVFVKLNAKDFSVPWDMVKKLINHKTKLIIINTPHNPTGAIMTAGDMLKLEKIVKNTDILILSDEVYEHIIFDGYEHQSVCRFPGLSNRSFVVSSFGKTYHATGLKLGYCLAPAKLMNEFRKIHQYLVFSCPTAVQYAIADYMEDENKHLQLGAFYQQKRDLFCNNLKDSSFKFAPSKGTYFQLLEYSKITDKQDVEFAEILTKENKIASIPISVFYNIPMKDLKYLRFCFAKNDETILKATEILRNLK
jgi:methionine transaminase